MQHSDSFAQVATALAAAQGAFPVIPRDRTVTVTSRRQRDDGSRAQYTFSYAPLSTILEKVRPALAANGLALAQSVITDDKGAEFVRTMLLHASGEWLANEIPVFTSGADNASQAYASGLTYARRYGVSTLLVLAADDDDDGNGNEDGQRAQRQQQGGRSGRQQPAPQRRPDAPTEPRAKPAPADAPAGDGAPLTPGAQRVLDAKAKAAGLSLEQVAERLGNVTMANFNGVLAELGQLANGGQQ